MLSRVRAAKQEGYYPYFRAITRSLGPEVEVDGRRLIMVGSNDYLGLTFDSRVAEAAEQALRCFGTGPGGSRFLCGNMSLHENLEERVAAFVGKKTSVVHTTGFLANLGGLTCLSGPKDVLLCDREAHASLFEGCRASGARVLTFVHNDPASAAGHLAKISAKHPEAEVLLITEGVFSMSGDVCELPALIRLKDSHPGTRIYLDDAHGLGVMGRGGRGTAQHFGLVRETDFVMGTFSKALASIGGFVASDDEDLMVFLKHQSRALMFTASLPASSAAAALACLEIIESEPERVERLWEITEKARRGYRDIGLVTGSSKSPIIPVFIGDEQYAFRFSVELFENGVFALPAVYPAVPRGQAIIRTAFMSTHEDRHLEFVLEVLDKLARKYRIRACDLETPDQSLAAAGQR
ncbi:MAG: pyridoxal phosphate-dependent aminotransferase family protein [Desulfovibrionaceae bacterium]|nr:pyridoxal phosphate-dependent aminotransferase family protein [Desulfovibrionaceae bacterium]